MNAIDPKMKISEILKMYPETLNIFRFYNMKCAEDNDYADKTLEENFVFEKVNFVNVLSQLDKIVHKQKPEIDTKKQQNSISDNRTEHGVCEVCGKTSKLYKIEVLLAKKDDKMQFKKIRFYECKACLKGSWVYWLLITLVLVFLIIPIVLLYDWLISSGLQSGTAWKLIGLILLIIVPLSIKSISYISRSPIKYMDLEAIRNLLQEGYYIAYVHSKHLDMLSGDIALSKHHGIVHLAGSKSYYYSEGFQKKCTTQVKENDIIWTMPLKAAFIKASQA